MSASGVLEATEAAAYGASRTYFPDWAVSFSSADSAASRWDYQVRLYRRRNDRSSRDLLASEYVYTQAYSTEPGSCVRYGINADYDSSVTTPASASISAVNAAIFRKVVSPTTQLRTSVLNLPLVTFSDNSGANEFMFSLLLPVLILIPLAPFGTYISSEKAGGLFNIMSMSGLRAPMYWASSVSVCFLFYVLYGLFIIAVALLFAIAEFKNNSFWVLFAAFLTWAYSAMGYSVLIGGMFRDPDSASLFGKLLIIVAALVNMAFASVEEWMPVFLYVPLPVLGFLRSLSLLMQFPTDEIESGSEIQAGLIASVVTGTIALVLGPYLHAVIPNQNANVGTPAHPLFFLKWFTDSSTNNRTDGRRPPVDPASAGASSPPHSRLGVSPPPLPDQYLDEDVVAEHTRVANGDLPPSTTMVVKDLTVGFPVKGTGDAARQGTHWAVQAVSFALQSGSTTGLLGPNGAGKSTLINVLAGNLLATSGGATIGGFDIGAEMGQIHRLLGICPQFDTVFQELTVSEQLTFFARLKGIPAPDVVAAVLSAAERVELDGDAFNVSADGLSGGMRRRLSLAIALIGDPMVVLLDEPTTGLDPLTVRSIWDIIQREDSKGRTLLITTHSMDEAEALCPRIGVMVKGRLAAIGQQAHLRKKFGDGFKLWMGLSSESDAVYDAVHSWVASTVGAGFRPSSRTGAYVSFNLPASVDIATLFSQLETRKVTLGVVEHGLSNASLDRVFANVVERAEAAEAQVGRGVDISSPL